jgi:guanylate kinase
MSTDPEFTILNPKPLLIVISGPSGVGKDTVMLRMRERGMPFHFVVTATTRPKREDEVHGVNYFFVTKDEFARMIEENELIEYAIVYSDYKGIPKQQVREALASGKDVVMRLDVQGAETVRRLAPGALLIFITTESEEELVGRLKARKTETPMNWPCASLLPARSSSGWRHLITSSSTTITSWMKRWTLSRPLLKPNTTVSSTGR